MVQVRGTLLMIKVVVMSPIFCLVKGITLFYNSSACYMQCTLLGHAEVNYVCLLVTIALEISTFRDPIYVRCT
jgi:hypothetical protein